MTTSNRNLRDDLHREMIASERPWSAAEIARHALKMVSGPASVQALVSAILAGDARFRRTGEDWEALQIRPVPPLDGMTFLLAECSAQSARNGAPAFLAVPWEIGAPLPDEVLSVLPDGGGLSSLAAMLEDRIIATLTPGSVRAALHRFERQYAMPSVQDRILDLQQAAREFALAVPSPRSAEAPVSVEERLQATGGCLRKLLERVHGMSWKDLSDRLDRVQASCVPVSFDSYRFGRAALLALPERPGVYRFLDEKGNLLYIGKSRNLRQRVQGYFRPLAKEHERRARLLEAIHDLVWETTPSELEALVIEGEGIRSLHPPFNQQIDVHPGADDLAPADHDMAFVLCEGDEEEVSVFFLRAGRAHGRARLPRRSDEEARSHALHLARAWLLGESGASHWTPIGEAESILVRRYLRLFGDRVDRLAAIDAAEPQRAADALLRLAGRDRPAWDPWRLRS